MQHAPAPLIRRCGLPRPKSHAIPLSPAPTRAHERWNIKDLLPRLEGLAGELHAKLQSPRLETATRTARAVRSGTAKPAAPARTIMPRCSETWTPDVTNVVKSEHFQPLNTGSCYKRRQTKPKHPISGEIAGGLTTFVTITQEDAQKVAQIDDVCNTKQLTGMNSQA